MTMFARLAETLESDWRLKARPSQLPPPGAWVCWLILTGRGWGKTRCGAEWVRSQVTAGCSRLALVGATAADVRDIMVEGESGVLAISPNHFRPEYQPGLRRLTWPNGAIATCYSADEPDRLRGPQHDGAWCDEAASWRYPDAFDMLLLGLRIGKNPRVVVTTTPRPVKLIRNLLAGEGKDVAVTRGRTIENAANLAPAFLGEITRRYEGTRLGRQELDAEVLEDVPGALWQRNWFERDRVVAAPELVRLVVAIDPALSTAAGADETGVIVAGVGGDGHAYIIDDISGRMAPNDWASRAIAAYRMHGQRRVEPPPLVAPYIVNGYGEVLADPAMIVRPPPPTERRGVPPCPPNPTPEQLREHQAALAAAHGQGVPASLGLGDVPAHYLQGGMGGEPWRPYVEGDGFHWASVGRWGSVGTKPWGQ